MTGPSAGWLNHYHDCALFILEPEEWPGWLDPSAVAQALMPALRPERFELAA